VRTAIFNKFASLSEDFRKDFDLLWEVPEEQREKLLPWVPQIYRTEVVGKEKMLLDKAVTETGGDASKLLRVLGLLLFIHGQWDPVKDRAEAFMRDLGDLGLLPENRQEEANKFLLEFLAAVEQDNQRRLEKMHAVSVLPNYLGASTLVDFRAVIAKPFGTGLADEIDEYQPTCISFVPVVLVQLRSSDDSNGEFVFQCEEDDLEMLIDQLESAKKDLAAAKRSLPGEVQE